MILLKVYHAAKGLQKAICEIRHKQEQKIKIIWITLDHFGSPNLEENQPKLTQMGLLRNN